jgi:RimJ/RimL family protein N-acetyltransferase
LIELREVVDGDLPTHFAQQADLASAEMAGVPARDRAAFDEHWARIRADPTTVLRTIVLDGEIVGSVLAFERDGVREVGYRIGREHWGRGIATRALAAFLEELTERPLHAQVTHGNAGSIRVLEKCGFRRDGGDEELAYFVLD